MGERRATDRTAAGRNRRFNSKRSRIQKCSPKTPVGNGPETCRIAGTASMCVKAVTRPPMQNSVIVGSALRLRKHIPSYIFWLFYLTHRSMRQVGSGVHLLVVKP